MGRSALECGARGGSGGGGGGGSGGSSGGGGGRDGRSARKFIIQNLCCLRERLLIRYASEAPRRKGREGRREGKGRRVGEERRRRGEGKEERRERRGGRRRGCVGWCIGERMRGDIVQG